MNHFEDMQTFVRVVEAGSITKAAEQLNTVKSAVSQRLSRLETKLGTQLLSRTTRSQTLTDVGSQYYQACLRILDDVAETEAQIKHQDQALAGRIKLAIPLSFGLNHLSCALRRFNQLHPEVVFELDFNDRQVDLINEGFDLAIRIARLQDSSLIARKITHTQIILSASPSYLEQYGTPNHPDDLKHGHVKLQYSSAPGRWQFKDANNKTYSVKVPTVLTCNNGDFMRDAAIDGLGLVLIPDFVCSQAIKDQQLIPLLCDYRADNQLNAYAVYPQNRHVPARIKALIEFLSDYFGDTPAWQVYEPINQMIGK